MAGLERLADRELGGMEALFVKGDAEIASRSTVVALFELDGEPDFEAVVDAHDRASRVVRRMRQRVIRPVVPISRPYWVVDPDFDLRYHVRQVGLITGDGHRDLLDLAQRLGQVPLDPARPLWEATLITGLADGGSAVLYKFHHAITDGAGGPQLLGEIFGDDPATESGPLPPAPAVEDVTAVELTRQRLGQLPYQLVGSLIGTLGGAISLGHRAARKPRGAVTGAVDYAGSARRTMSETVCEPSPLLARRGLRRYYASIQGSTADLKATATRLGCSLNDVYMAALSAGLGSYHEEFGWSLEAVPIAVPVSIRRGDDPVDSNRFVGARIAGPVAAMPPAERVRLVGEQIQRARSEPALDLMSKIAPAASMLPLWLLVSVAGPQRVDLQASNVRSWPAARYVGGVKVTATFSFGPLATAAIMAVLSTYDGHFDIGLNLDLDAVSEPELLVRLLQAAFAEITGSAPRATT